MKRPNIILKTHPSQFRGKSFISDTSTAYTNKIQEMFQIFGIQMVEQGLTNRRHTRIPNNQRAPSQMEGKSLIFAKVGTI